MMDGNTILEILVGVNTAFLGWVGLSVINLSNRITRLETMAEFFELSKTRASQFKHEG